MKLSEKNEWNLFCVAILIPKILAKLFELLLEE